MKRFLLLFLIFIFTSLTAEAQIMKAKVIDEISTMYPKDVVKIELTKDITLSGTDLKKGYIVTGSLTDVKSPGKGDKEASFMFTLLKYKDFEGLEHNFSKEVKTVYKRKHFKWGCDFLNDADFSFSPIPNANINSYGNETDITGRTSQNMSVKPLSIAESFLPKDVRDELKDDTDYKTGLSSEGEDILILSGERIKFDFPDN